MHALVLSNYGKKVQVNFTSSVRMYCTVKLMSSVLAGGEDSAVEVDDFRTCT